MRWRIIRRARFWRGTINFKLLFSEHRIGALTLRNRLGMAPMTTGYGEPDGGVNDRVEHNGIEHVLPGIDIVVVAAGMRPHLPLRPEELGDGVRCLVVGDAVEPLNIFEAVHSASRAVRELL